MVLSGELIHYGTFEERQGERTVIDAQGWYLTPSFIDHHCHVYPTGTEMGLYADTYAFPQGCTALVDAGSTGVANYRSFQREIATGASADIYAYLNVAAAGQVSEHNPEYVHPDFFSDSFADFLKAHPGIRGLKIRFDTACTRNLGLRPLNRAAEIAHELKVPLSVHIAHHPCTLREILATLQSGDILCHMYQDSAENILTARGEIRPEVLEARERGVLFESADGFANCALKVARQAIARGFKPDIISTDLTREKLYTLRGYGLAFTLSKYHALGMTWPEVIRAATLTPREVLHRGAPWPLKEGTRADLVLFSLLPTQGFTFTDSQDTTLEIPELLKVQLTVHRGKSVYCAPESLTRMQRFN
ncbi:MAG TPA: amidohydrolase family protein [Candidatus Avisuccinivibrio pullicola]|nr:amidohydrolase family protein [Candidatus Avisuccinivibrio pullicola]